MTKSLPQAPRGRSVLIAFFVAQAVYMAMLTLTLPALETLAGGLKPFDMQPGGYDFITARQLLDALGEEGRAFYLTRQVPLDLLYPGLFALAYGLLWRWLAPRAWPDWVILGEFAWLPVCAGLADYAENGFIVGILLAYPLMTESLVTMASAATVTKSVLTTITMIALALMLIRFAGKRFATRLRP